MGLGHPSQFQRVSHLGFVTAATSLNGGQPNFARCLAVSWAGTLCMQFGGCCPLTEFCQVQNSLCVQVLRSPICCQHYCTALEQWASAKLYGIQQRAPLLFGRAAITLGIGPHSSFVCLTHRYCVETAIRFTVQSSPHCKLRGWTPCF